MTRELDNLLAAVKAIGMCNYMIEIENLHRAITEFEAVREAQGELSSVPPTDMSFGELQNEYERKNAETVMEAIIGPIPTWTGAQ